MFVRLHRQRHRGREYTSVHLCESYRDPEKGGKPRNRVIANLGPVEKIGMDAVRNLANGFSRIAGEQRNTEHLPRLLGAKDFGHVFAVAETWKGLGLSAILSRAGIEGETTFPTADLIELMVVNRQGEGRTSHREAFPVASRGAGGPGFLRHHLDLLRGG
jgi:hypothetical protein